MAYCECIETVLDSKPATITNNISISGGFVLIKDTFIINFMRMYKEDSEKPHDKQNLLIVLT